MDPTAALIRILEHLRLGHRRSAVYELVCLAKCLTENRHGFMPDVDEAIETYNQTYN